MTELPSPRQVVSDRYELVERIGGGGMGAVYRAHDRLLDRTVAIKTLRVLDDRQQALLLREARLLNSLAEHAERGFVRQYDVIVQDDQIYLVQEFLDAESLYRWQPGRSVEELVRTYAQIAAAIAFLHGRGIVHRDLKPSNVMIERRTLRPIVIDLGLAVRAREHDNLTAVGTTVVGTQGYLPPEIVSGADAGPPADVFSLGVMLAEAIAGRLPWSTGSVTEQLLGVIRESRDETLKRLPEVSGAGLDSLVKSMIAIAPDARPTAEAVATALMQWQPARGSGPPPAPAAAPVAPPATPRPTPVVALRARPASPPRPTVIVSAPAHRRSPVWFGLSLAAGVGTLAAIVYLAVRIGWQMVPWIAVVLAGAVLMVLAARRRRSPDAPAGPASQAVLDRINAIEAQISRADAMTQSLAVAIDTLGTQMSPDRLREVVRESVLLTLENLQPATADGPEFQRVLGFLSALRQPAVPERRPLLARLKEYGVLFSGGLTTVVGVVGLLNTTALWQPNHAPEITALGPSDARLRPTASLPLSVEAHDPDGDELTFDWSASGGRIEARGSGAIWIPTPGFADRLVNIKVTVSDGDRSATRTRTLQVNGAPAGRLRVDGELRAGTPVRLVAEASDPDGDAITYEWVASSGSLMQRTGAVVFWQSPDGGGRVEVLCNVHDGFETVPLTLSLDVPAR